MILMKTICKNVFEDMHNINLSKLVIINHVGINRLRISFFIFVKTSTFINLVQKISNSAGHWFRVFL